jgi:hypothetical protein
MLKMDDRIEFLKAFWDERIADKSSSEVPEEDLIEFFVDEVSK